MDESRRYSVSELAELVGVPRTTINDWLNRYPQYIDFSTQGKRKVYSDASVTVLKEILELRNSELSSFDIEAQLAKRHPVRGEAVPPEEYTKRETPAATAQNREACGDSANSIKDKTPHEQQGEEYALIAKKQTDEIARLLGEHLQNLARRMDEIERHNREATARAQRWYFVAILMALALAVFGVFAAIKINATTLNAQKLNEEKARKDSELQSMENEFVKLVRDSDDYRRNISELEKNLKKQSEEFERQLQEARRIPASAEEAENLTNRDKLAGEKLEALKKLTEGQIPSGTETSKPAEIPASDKKIEILSIGEPEIKP